MNYRLGAVIGVFLCTFFWTINFVDETHAFPPRVWPVIKDTSKHWTFLTQLVFNRGDNSSLIALDHIPGSRSIDKVPHQRILRISLSGDVEVVAQTGLDCNSIGSNGVELPCNEGELAVGAPLGHIERVDVSSNNDIYFLERSGNALFLRRIKHSSGILETIFSSATTLIPNNDQLSDRSRRRSKDLSDLSSSLPLSNAKSRSNTRALSDLDKQKDHPPSNSHQRINFQIFDFTISGDDQIFIYDRRQGLVGRINSFTKTKNKQTSSSFIISNTGIQATANPKPHITLLHQARLTVKQSSPLLPGEFGEAIRRNQPETQPATLDIVAINGATNDSALGLDAPRFQLPDPRSSRLFATPTGFGIHDESIILIGKLVSSGQFELIECAKRPNAAAKFDQVAAITNDLLVVSLRDVLDSSVNFQLALLNHEDRTSDPLTRSMPAEVNVRRIIYHDNADISTNPTPLKIRSPGTPLEEYGYIGDKLAPVPGGDFFICDNTSHSLVFVGNTRGGEKRFQIADNLSKTFNSQDPDSLATIAALIAIQALPLDVLPIRSTDLELARLRFLENEGLDHIKPRAERHFEQEWNKYLESSTQRFLNQESLRIRLHYLNSPNRSFIPQAFQPLLFEQTVLPQFFLPPLDDDVLSVIGSFLREYEATIPILRFQSKCALELLQSALRNSSPTRVEARLPVPYSLIL